jgi:hypothetical protein
MKPGFTASAIILSFVPHLIADAIITSVKASAGYYDSAPPFGVHMYPCTGDGVTQETCGADSYGSNKYASFSGSASVYFAGGTTDTFEASLDMTQNAYNFVDGFGEVQTIAGFDAYGVASGGTGPGTLTYDISVLSLCAYDPSGCSGPFPPNLIAPGTRSSIPCPFNNTDGYFVCFEGIVHFTFGVPFPFSFEMISPDFVGNGIYTLDTDAFEYLSFLSMTVSGTGTSADISLVPDVPTFRLGLLGLFSTVGLIAFRRWRYIPIDE